MLNINTNRPGGAYNLGGIEVARVGYGAMQLPRLKDAKAARAVLRRAYELGVNHFDTARFYGNGEANRYLAEELSGEPDVMFVTKIGVLPVRRGAMPMVAGQRPEELRQEVLENIKSLKVEQLHVVNLRRIAPGTFPLTAAQKVNFDDQMAEMVAMRDEGLIAAIGLSAVSLDELRQALPAGIACVQNQYSITSRKQEPVLKLCLENGIAWVPFFPLGSSMPGSAKAAKEPVVQKIAQTLGYTPAQVGLAWLLQHADNTLIIPGTSSIAHLEQNIVAGAVHLDEQSMASLNALKPVSGISGFFGRFRRG